LHGGTVTLNSEVGKGSTFSIRLPYFGKDATGHVQPDTTGAAPVRRLRPLALMIEDDPRSAELLRIQLTSAGLDIVPAPNGEQGLRLAQEMQPDVITLDLMLPGMDGAEFLRNIKSDARLAPIPVIVISIVEEAQRAVDLGAAAVLQKPVDRQAL